MSDKARLGAKLEAYHWGLHFTPKDSAGKTTTLYHAVNQRPGDENFNPDPKIFQFEKKTIDPTTQKSLLGRVKLGTQPEGTSASSVDDLLKDVPAPNKNLDPSGSCVTWAICGIRKLQENKIVEQFDTKTFSNKVLEYGEERFKLLKDVKDVESLEKLQRQVGRLNPKDTSISVDKKPGTGILDVLLPKKKPGITGEIPDPGTSGTFTPCRRDGRDCKPGKPNGQDPSDPNDSRQGDANDPKKKDPKTPDQGNPKVKGACIIQKRDGSGCQQIAERSATKKFKAMAEKNGLSELVKRKSNPVTFSGLRSTTMEKFGNKLAYKVKLGAAKLSGATNTALSVGPWIKEVTDVFSAEATALERVAVATSLIPTVGCVTSGALANEQGRNGVINTIDTTACIVADVAALFGGGPFVSFAIHMARALFRFVENLVWPPDPPEFEKAHYQYKWGWSKYFSQIETTLRSDDFKGNLTAQLVAEKLDVLFMAGELLGSIQATIESGGSNDTTAGESENTDDKKEKDQSISASTNAKAQANDEGPGRPSRRDNNDTKDLDKEPSEDDSTKPADDKEPDLQPKICEAYTKRKERLMTKMGEDLEKSMEDAYAKYDVEFFNGFHPWLYRHLRQIRGSVPSVSTLETERDQYIEKLKDKYKRGDKTGLEPGPGADRVRMILQEVVDEVTRRDPCQQGGGGGNKPKGNEDRPEPLPGLPEPVDIPKDQGDLEAKEAKWREELEGPLSPWAKEQGERDKIWAAVREKEIKSKMVGKDGKAPPPKEGDGDSPDWDEFDKLWDKYKKSDQGNGDNKNGPDSGTGQGPGQKEPQEPDEKPELEPSGSSMLICASGGYQNPCLQATTGPGKCVNIPEDFKDVTSSIRLNDEAGKCDFFQSPSCEGEAATTISSPGLDLTSEPNRNLDDKLKSYRCNGSAQTLQPEGSNMTLFVAKTYSYQKSKDPAPQTCNFYYDFAEANEGNWIGIWTESQDFNKDEPWSWKWAKSERGTEMVDCKGLRKGYKAFVVAQRIRKVVLGPLDL